MRELSLSQLASVTPAIFETIYENQRSPEVVFHVHLCVFHVPVCARLFLKSFLVIKTVPCLGIGRLLLRRWTANCNSSRRTAEGRRRGRRRNARGRGRSAACLGSPASHTTTTTGRLPPSGTVSPPAAPPPRVQRVLLLYQSRLRILQVEHSSPGRMNYRIGLCSDPLARKQVFLSNLFFLFCYVCINFCSDF